MTIIWMMTHFLKIFNFNSNSKLFSYMAELLQHLLAVSQVWSHELGCVHLDFLFYFPGGQARLEEGQREIQLTIQLTKKGLLDYRKHIGE